MTTQSNMLNTFEKHKYDQTIVTNSRNWFRQQAQLLVRDGVKPKATFSNAGKIVATIKPGNLYMFFYDPKHKETLPYYDKFPMVFPFAASPTGFTGLNMHYLSYRFRIILLDNLLKFKNTKGLDETTKLRYSWDVIKGISKHKLAEHCVKSYLYDHIVTNTKMISPVDWTSALMMPVESFAKATSSQVWKNTGGL
jgi:hypothetical protein